MQIRSILIGGLAPAILLGLSTVLMKLSMKTGIGLPVYIICVGSTITLYGIIAYFLSNTKDFVFSGATYAILMGIAWATSSLCMAYGVSTLKLPVAIVAPLSNSNAIVAVLLSAWIFAEWKDLDVTKVVVGTLLIVIGATVVSMSLPSK